MQADDVLSLGLGVTPPWKLIGQRLDPDKRPNELHIEVAADRGARFPCPDRDRPCKAHDFAELTWRHLNFFQHHCLITAKVPRTDCPDHGVKRIQVPWAREGSRFTLLFEQAAVILARAMPVLAADRGLTEKQAAALAELESKDLFTTTPWRIKEKLRWIRKAETLRAARSRGTSFIRHARHCIAGEAILEPLAKALETFERHLERILQRWTSTHNNARKEGLNGLFQAARARACGYRNTATFITIIYLIAAPLGNLFDSI